MRKITCVPPEAVRPPSLVTLGDNDNGVTVFVDGVRVVSINNSGFLYRNRSYNANVKNETDGRICLAHYDPASTR